MTVILSLWFWRFNWIKGVNKTRSLASITHDHRRSPNSPVFGDQNLVYDFQSDLYHTRMKNGLLCLGQQMAASCPFYANKGSFESLKKTLQTESLFA